MALSSLTKIYAYRGETKKLRETLEQVLTVVTDYALARARIYIAVLSYGDAAQKAHVRPLAEAFDFITLTSDVREELEALLR